jgi:hypothetical protein
MANVKRWVFHDPVTNETWTVPINPNEMGTLFPEKNIMVQVTSAVDGQALLFEGQSSPVSWEFSGVILTVAHHQELLRWSRKRNRIRITDHYGRVIECYLTKFAPVPKRSQRKWKHDYTMSAIITKTPTAPTMVQDA